MTDQEKYTSKLNGKRVLVVGGSSGVGYAIAEASLESGAIVTISSSNPSRVTKAVSSLQAAYPSKANNISSYPCDVSNRASIETNIISLLDFTGGHLDNIVWTAGPPLPATPISQATLQNIDEAFTVRYTAPLLLAKHAPKYLSPGPGSSITLTTGVVTERPIPNWSVLAGARSAVIGLTKNLALDLRPVRVNCVALGAVDTATWAPLSEEAKERTFAALVGRSTTGRIADAQDVAEAYLYCMRDSNVSGSVVSSNGGVTVM